MNKRFIWQILGVSFVLGGNLLMVAALRDELDWRFELVGFAFSWIGLAMVTKGSKIIRFGVPLLITCGSLIVNIKIVEAPLHIEEENTRLIVDRYLAAPSTAQYKSVRTIERGKNGFVLAEVTVDAQNIYGAMLRNHYYVVYRRNNTTSEIFWNKENGVQAFEENASPDTLNVIKSMNDWPGTAK